jgi:3,4-dihydroxy 2-butanone 4-phosphate synthase/GTP cyclohydrolase II
VGIAAVRRERQDLDAERSVERAVKHLATGGLVVLYDDHRDQGDLIAAAQLTTAATVTLMVHRGGGLVAVALTPDQSRELGLQSLPMKRDGGRRACERTPTMVSVEARHGVSTGISSADRARTIKLLAEPARAPRSLVSPGHVFPLVACEGGLLERPGRLEAAVDAVRLAGLAPAATMCDVLDDRGDLAPGDQLLALANGLGIPFITISKLSDARADELWNSRPQPYAGAAPSVDRDAGAFGAPALH